MDAIILGLGVNGIAVVRSLGCKGLTVGGIFFNKEDELGAHSRYLKKSVKVKPSCSSEDLLAACESLVDLNATRARKTVIICTSDYFASKVAEKPDIFENNFLITTPKPDIYWKFLAKKPTADICLKHKFPIPDTFYTNEKGRLIEECENLNYPAIIKPNFTFDDEFPGKNIIISTRNELLEFVKKMPNLETKVVVQEIIPSGDGNIYLVSTFSDTNGKVRVAYSGKKIRQYLPDYGVTCFGVSEDIPKLKDSTINFLEKINYTGFATLEFAHDKKKDIFVFIELNIRTFYHNQLFKDAGIDINHKAFEITHGSTDNENCLRKQKDDVYWIDFTRDIASFFRKKKQGKLSTLKWLNSILKARSFAYFDHKDPIPFFVSLYAFIKIRLKSIDL